MTAERKFLFGLILQAITHRKSTENRQGTNFAAICLMLKSSVTVHQHVIYNMPRMLQSSLVINGLSSWMILCTFPCLSVKTDAGRPETFYSLTEIWPL